MPHGDPFQRPLPLLIRAAIQLVGSDKTVQGVSTTALSYTARHHTCGVGRFAFFSSFSRAKDGGYLGETPVASGILTGQFPRVLWYIGYLFPFSCLLQRRPSLVVGRDFLFILWGWAFKSRFCFVLPLSLTLTLSLLDCQDRKSVV